MQSIDLLWEHNWVLGSSLVCVPTSGKCQNSLALFSEGQRKSHYEENEAEKQENNDLIETLKKEIKIRLQELADARAVIGENEQIKKYLNEVSPIGNKNVDQVPKQYLTL